MHEGKVKFSREEYRKEFLLSDFWRGLRAKLLGNQKKCSKCNQVAPLDLHHMFYPNDIYNTQKKHVIALCRECHDFIHDAIKVKALPKNHNRYLITNITKERVTLFKKKSFTINEELANYIENKVNCEGRRRIAGVLKISPPLSWLQIIGVKIKLIQLNTIEKICNFYIGYGGYTRTDSKIKDCNRFK